MTRSARLRSTAGDLYDRLISSRLRIARLVPAAGFPLVSAVLTGSVALGVLPVVFILQTSVMLGLVPDAVAGGTDSPAWTKLVTAFLIAAAVFVAQQILAPVQTALGELVSRRVDGMVHERLMRSCLSTAGIAPLEDQRILNDLDEASRQLDSGFTSPGKACAGLLALAARYTQLIGCVVLVGAEFSWPAAVALGAATMVFRCGQRGGLRRYSHVFAMLLPVRRKAYYLRELSIEAPAAKEIRVFGLIGWLGQTYRTATMDWMMPVWAKRRAVYLWPYLAFTAFGLVAVAFTLCTAGRAAAESLPLTNLALVLQAGLAAVHLGGHYPESDTATQFGMLAYDSVQVVERGMRDYAEADAGIAKADATLVEADATLAASGPRAGAGLPATRPQSEIHFDGLTFGYPDREHLVFDGLDLRLPAGKCTALVGVNGAGKTTLVKLLTRLHEPTSGSIKVDGTDLRTVDIDSWRAQIGVIFQTFNRYHLTAAENIGFGAVEQWKTRSDAIRSVRAAADAAGILEVLEALPNGLQTPLARAVPGGVDLSGGQWQRVALARALYALDNGASVLVLDEPTASLDVRAEAQFFADFVGLTPGVTTLLISHRFSTVRHADNIVVLEHGRVTEQGTHEQLMAADGRYAELFRLQAERFSEVGA